MKLTRRHFIRDTGIALGALTLPAWSLDAAPARALTLENKNDLADIAMSLARRLGASYADIRVNRYRTESIATRERQVLNVGRNESFGFGVRVLVRGTWGFASSGTVSAAEVRRITRKAIEVARANARFQRKPVQLVPAPKVVDTWKSAFEKDPFEVALENKIAFLLELNEAALDVSGVSFVNSSMSWVNEQKFFGSTDGSRIDQYLIRGNPSFSVTAVDRAANDFQSRNSLGGPQAMGYEYLEKRPWLAEAKTAGEEAVEKLKGKPVEPGEYDLVLDPTHLWLTIHESVGHPTELDRALWWEANFAGTSFITVEKTGSLQFGSEMVNFYADRTQPTGLATVGYDDEGVPAQRWDMVRNGIFVDWQTTRDLAPLIGRTASNGCLHADSWGSVPFPRMPNISLEPARTDTKLEDLVRDVEKGILIHGNGSFSIDQQRYNFQFGGQTFREIREGRIVGMLRDVAYQSRTTDFWRACDGLGGQATYALGGAFNDGKGEPMQSNAVSHGCPVARFRRIPVLNTNRS